MDNSKALTNRIEVQFDRKRIDKDFSIFAIMTDEKFIKKGARILDDPNNELKAVSMVFDYGRLAWIMLRKSDGITSSDILKYIERDEENKGHFTVTQKSSWDLSKDYLLFRLFLYSLNLEKKEKYAFNNLTGKLFLSSEEWMNKKGTFNALQIDVDWQMNLSVVFTTFSTVSVLKKYKQEYNDMPKYTWSGNGFMLKRTFDDTLDDDSVFIHTAVSKKTKPHMDFYCYFEDKRENTKVYYSYMVLNALKDRYSSYFKSELCFASLDIIKQNDSLDDKKYMENVINHFVGDNALSIRLINMCEDEENVDEYNNILETMKSELYKILHDEDGVVADISIRQRFMPSPNTCYIVLHHNAEHYKGKDDPYAKLKRDVMPIQSITVEDSKELVKKGSIKEKSGNLDSFYKTILKELVIKNDIITNKTITMDKWGDRLYEKNWVFGIEQNDARYMMLIFPNGAFKIFKDEGFGILPFKCQYEEVEKAATILRDSKDKTKSVVVDQNGNSILLYRSGMCVMPKEEILHLDHNKHGRPVMDEYFAGGYDTTIYQRGLSSYYSSGIPHGSPATVPNATNIYSVKVMHGENTIDSLLKTFGVPFVRLESFTVLPFPFKYVREYADMEPKKEKKQA